ncbi:MAG: hypothetical protein SH850_07070 [Planctomycetaceae bacterium]|nr:hypothetical protein [Planctomycetaceae bacterium]
MWSVQQLLSLVMAVGLCVPAWSARDCCCSRRAQDSGPSCCAKKTAAPQAKCCAAKRAVPAATATPVCQCHKEVTPQAVRPATSSKVAETLTAAIAAGASLPAIRDDHVATPTPFDLHRHPPRMSPPLLMLCRSLS